MTQIDLDELKRKPRYLPCSICGGDGIMVADTMPGYNIAGEATCSNCGGEGAVEDEIIPELIEGIDALIEYNKVVIECWDVMNKYPAVHNKYIGAVIKHAEALDNLPDWIKERLK